MAKIAVAVERALAQRAVHGTPGGITARLVAEGDGWAVHDMICTAGPRDRAFEERHSEVAIAIVAAGSFQYRSAAGRELMTPGSIMLGSPGECFECGHEHGEGDRCLSFHYSPEYFERLAADAGGRSGFRALRLPPLRALSPLVARGLAGLAGAANVAWEELGVELAAQAVELVGGLSPGVGGIGGVSAAAEARVARTVRLIEREPRFRAHSGRPRPSGGPEPLSLPPDV